MYFVNWNTLCEEEKRLALKRPAQSENSSEFIEKVRQIISTVKKEGDRALLNFTEQFDGTCLQNIRVSKEEIQEAYTKLDTASLQAIRTAIQGVKCFHEAQLPKDLDLETFSGVRCERRFLPISNVGLYVPCGTAALPSTVIMLGVPSSIAGCERRVLMTPPLKDGSVDPSILVSADLLGISEIFKVGGAQAIAALAYGTESVPKVDKIFGPGNRWVTEAKMQVAYDPEGALSDLPAGPSELMIIADKDADARFIAADLLSQAEHGTDSQVILVASCGDLIQRVLSEVQKQIECLPRFAIAKEALTKSRCIQVNRMEDAVEVSNRYAPEHLIIQTENARELSLKIRNAGSIFLGPWAPESVGDYASGTSHVLPTYGFARVMGGLGTESFMKSLTVQELTRDALKELSSTVMQLAAMESLEAHANAVRIRLQELAV